MGGHVVDLSSVRATSNGHAPESPPLTRYASVGGVPRLTALADWDTDWVVSVLEECGGRPHRACAHLEISLTAANRAFDVNVLREGWEHLLTLQGRQSAFETPERRWKREGVLWLLHQVHCAIYGVPTEAGETIIQRALGGMTAALLYPWLFGG